MKAVIAAMPLAFVLLVSGCTVPGLDFLGMGGQQISYENDVIVISALSVLPAEVKPGQNVMVYADVQNVLKPGAVPAGAKYVTAAVDLYDYCPNMFTLKSGPNGENSPASSIDIIILNPQEVKSLKWKLTASPDIKMQNKCEFKLRVNYKFKTDAISTVTFISQAEYDRKLRAGEPMARQGTNTVGIGPVKPDMKIDGPQPVEAGDKAPLIFKAVNRGSGFVTSKDKNDRAAVTVDLFTLADALGADNECEIRNGEKIEIFVEKQSSPRACPVGLNQTTITEQTYPIKMQISYDYEFRKTAWATITPPKV
jgi:hypothetical protein